MLIPDANSTKNRRRQKMESIYGAGFRSVFMALSIAYVWNVTTAWRRPCMALGQSGGSH